MTEFAGQDYQRIKEGFRFRFQGMKLKDQADSIGPDKAALAVNIRGYGDQHIRTRPGLSLEFSLGTPSIVTDIGTYVTLGTAGATRVLTRDANDNVYLDTTASVGTLAGGGASPGASMLPFRPNESPNPWMYVANGTDYQKFSAPVSNTVTQYKAGIAEPQSAPDASFNDGTGTPLGTMIYNLEAPAHGSYTQAGNAGAASAGTRSTDTIVAVAADPLTVLSECLYSLQVASTVQYQPKMLLFDSTKSTYLLVQDVYPANPATVNIAGIYYYSGTTGHCIIVPTGMPVPAGEAVTQENFLSSLRRGSLIKIGTDVCYVWSVTVGPDNSIAIETSTATTHAIGAAITILPAIQVVAFNAVPAASDTIAATSIAYTVTSGGIGTSTFAATDFFVNGSSTAFQDDDYLSIGILIDVLNNLTEFKILFDVSDGNFTKDYYYYAVRSSDILPALTNTLTQVGAAQVASQLALIDKLQVNNNDELQTDSGTQVASGNNTWTQLFFPISALTRVGSDSTKSLQTLVKIQFLWNVNANGNMTVAHDQNITVIGGYQPDVGDAGAPYQYCVRPRSIALGIYGNPSPPTRYGISPRRQQVTVKLPSSGYDLQIDTWDVFRYGGTITSWRFVGSTPASSAYFYDNFSDDAVGAGDALDYDNFEPWPSIDVPLVATAIEVVGYIATITIVGTTNVLRYLPGTLVLIGGINVYTLRKRPTLVTGTTYLVEFNECANYSTNNVLAIQEPILAFQPNPYMFGTDASGTVFACGDALRPGTLSFSKPNAPDAAPDTFNIEICQPSEPLMGGEILDGLAFVASTERVWALYTQFGNPQQRYNIIQQPISRGFASAYGHCNDGTAMYWWAKDGIYSSKDGSLTDADLYILFPHEGVSGSNYSYNGYTIYAPNYTFINSFRLTYSNGFLYATYIGMDGNYHMLVCFLERKAWNYDVYASPVTAVTHVVQSENGTNPITLMALNAGTTQGVYQQLSGSNDGTTPISCILATFEFDGGDLRAGEQWGDIFFDVIPLAAISVTPMFLGVPSAPLKTIPAASSRTQIPISIGGDLLTNFLGCYITWTDNFTTQTSSTKLYSWQPSFLIKPPSIIDQFSDWNDAEIEGAKWFQGFVMHADTFNLLKGLVVRDADTLTTHSFTPVVQHNGESELAYSFNTPFIAHMVRLEPANDGLLWRLFDIRWVAEQTPEQAETWQTQGTSFGLTGYLHVKQVSAAYASAQAVTLTITSFDGQSPVAIILPPTGGAFQKATFQLTPNKGQLYFFKANSPVPFQMYLPDWEVMVGQWGRQDSYVRWRFGGDKGDQSKI